MKKLVTITVAMSTFGVFAWDTPTVKPGLPLIFPDDSQIAVISNATRCLHTGVKDKEPVLKKDQPWEDKGNCVYGSVWKMDDGSYRMWYCDWSWSNVADSKDGKTWTKPLQYEVRKGKNGEKTNMTDARGHCNSLIYDRFEKDPKKRYKHLGCGYKYNPDWSINKEVTGYYTCVSADGVKFENYHRALYGWDTASLVQHPETGEIFCYHKINTTGYAGRDDRRRVVFMSRTRDFEHWSDPVLVLAPDQEDDMSFTENQNQRMDIYTHTAFPYAGGFIGFMTMFRIDHRGPSSHGETADQGFCDVQLATSTDGVEWKRTPGRKTVLTRGEAPNWDSGGIWGLCGGEVVSNEKESMIYYYGWDSAHGRPVKPGLPQYGTLRATGRAVWRRWGFASIGTSAIGTFTTKPVKFTTEDIRLNVAPVTDPHQRSAGTYATVTVLDATGLRVLAESEPVKKDETLAKLVWKNGAKVPVNTPVVLRITVSAAAVYAVECM